MSLTYVAPARRVPRPRPPGGAVSFDREADMHAPIADIVDRLARGLPGYRSAPAHVLFEIPAAAGIPDVLRVAFSPAEIRRRTELGLAPVLDLTAVRSLAAVSGGPAGLGDVARRAGVTLDYLRRMVVPRLIDDGWLNPLSGRGDRTVVSPRHIYRSLVSSVVTVEAKRRDWRSAISQARRHQACADRAYVAIDAATPGRLLNLAEELARGGIGLLTVDASTGRAVEIARPTVGRPREDERRLIGERAWMLVGCGRSRWETFEVFGQDLAKAP